MSTNIIKTINSAKPIRMWIDGKCFNIQKFKRKSKKTQNEITNELPNDVKKSDNDNIEDNNCEDCFNKNKIDIVTDDTGKLSTSFHVPSWYYIKLYKFNDFDIDALSKKTKTSISVPKHGNAGKVVIAGDNEGGIQKAADELHSVIGEIRDQNAALQFISIPLLSDEIKNNFQKFKNEILSNNNIQGMDESIFQSHLKLHLTINVFVLLDEREKMEAISALEEYKTIFLKPLLDKTGPLKVYISGLDCMNDNLKKVDVLYAKARIINETEEVNLQKIANELSNYFYERGLLKRYQENVKLHMTLINTKYRKIPNSPSRKRWQKRQSFDATMIMEKYNEFVFGECNMDSIHLSLISSKGVDGFYQPLSIIKI